MAQSTKRSRPGMCEEHPDKTAWPTRESDELNKTIEMYEAQGYRVWMKQCPACEWWHMMVRGDEMNK